jgi:hypothetical protein
MKKTEMKKCDKKRSESILIIAHLMISIIAFAFMIGMVNGSITGVTDPKNYLGNINSPSSSPSPTTGNGFETGLRNLIGKNPSSTSSAATEATTFASRAKQSMLWAGGVAALGTVIKAISDDPLAQSLGTALQAGAAVGGLVNLIPSAGGWALGVGAAAGIVAFILTYKKTEQKTFSFACQTWEAPLGGENCEKCNDDMQTCSEYRCKSLGQACEIINAGTDKEMCYWASRKDVTSPEITPLQDVLTKSYKYNPIGTRPPKWGYEILNIVSSTAPDDKDCKNGIEPFTPITFGITTNKPAQCKIDFNATRAGGQIKPGTKDTTYDDMAYYFGGDNLYSYNHTQTMNLPGPKAVSDSANVNDTGGLEIQNDGRYTLFVRCRSANGYYNADPYEIKFCVKKGPDATAPYIAETSIRNNQPIQYGINQTEIVVYTNEPANCRWSFNDLDFRKMQYNMSCANSISEMQSNMLYACSGTLTEIKDRVDNNYYFKCEDQPWLPEDQRNRMTSSYELTLKGTQPLNIKKNSLEPNNETVTGATTIVNVTLELETENGYDKGNAECFYSQDNENNYIPFLTTNSYKHIQKQDLPAGTYIYFIKCIDQGGNQARTNTTFKVFVDNQAPQVVRMMYDADKLKIITDEDAKCYLNENPSVECNYALDDNVQQMDTTDNREHFATWNLQSTYYIKCKDKNDKQPNPTQCSAVIKPVNIVQSESE